MRLGQREGGDRAGGAARQVLLLLLLRAEELERLRDADRLVRGEQRGDVAVVAADHLHDSVMYSLTVKPRPPYSFGIFIPKAPSLPQAFDDLLGVLAGLVDRDGIDLLPEESPELVVERPELGPLLRDRREGMDEVEEEVAEEQLAEKRSSRPFLLA